MRVAPLLLVLCTASACLAQAAPATQTSPTRYRLTFLLSDPQGQQPSQSIVLDVPVMPGHMGNATMTQVSGVTDQEESRFQKRLSCTDVHTSATGLAVDVTYAEESVRAPMPDSTEPIHRQLNFERKVDLVLGKPMQITQEMHVKQLKKGDAAIAPAAPPATQITVTAAAL